jgi:hypothetical protein
MPGRRDSSPSVPCSVVLELRLDSGFATDTCHPCRRLLGSDDTTTSPAHLRAAAVCSPGRRYFYWTLFSTKHTIIVYLWLYYILIVQGDRRSFRQSGPRQPETTTPIVSPIFPLGGSRPPTFQLPAADIPSSSTRPMFQPTFDMTTEDQVGSDQMEFSDVLATLDAPQQAEGVGSSPLTRTMVWTQPTQPQGIATPAAGGGTPAGRGTLAGGGTPGCCRLVAGGHGDTASRPARTVGGQGT